MSAEIAVCLVTAIISGSALAGLKLYLEFRRDRREEESAASLKALDERLGKLERHVSLARTR